MSFDKKEHAEKLSSIGNTIINAAMLSKGISCASIEMNDRQYSDMAAGAFAILSIALNAAYDAIFETSEDFVNEYGLSYPLENKGSACNN